MSESKYLGRTLRDEIPKISNEINPLPITPRSGISSRSDFIHNSGFIPTKADLVEKSHSLSRMAFFLGIGIGERWNVFKVEVYEETQNGVRSICSYELNNTEYSTEYKSYYIERQNKLIGLGVVSDGESKYILLHFDQYELSELINVSLCGETENMRGVFIDGYMYMFGNNDFKVEKVIK